MLDTLPVTTLSIHSGLGPAPEYTGYVPPFPVVWL